MLTGHSVEQVVSWSETLQEAANALRNLVPAAAHHQQQQNQQQQQHEQQQQHQQQRQHEQQNSLSSTTASVPFGSVAGVPLGDGCEDAWTSVDGAASGRVTPSMPSMFLGSQISPVSGPSAIWERSNIANDQIMDMHRILVENASLREAYYDANCRISQLEDEKMHFFDEGIFDLVNNVCGQNNEGKVCKPTLVDLPAGDHSIYDSTPQRHLPAAGGRAGAAVTGFADRMDVQQMSPTPRLASAVGTAPLTTDVTPAYSMESELRRRQEELRSKELRRQNEMLRRELARAGEAGEALEFQKEVAEERMLELEQEQQWLRERFAGIAALPVSPTPIRGPAAPSFHLPMGAPDGSPVAGEPQLRSGPRAQAHSDDSPALTQRQAAARATAEELGEVNRRLRLELDEASRRYDRLLQATEDTERITGGVSAEANEETRQAEVRLEALRAEVAEAAARAEAAASREQQLRLENEALEAERRQAEEQQASRDRIIGDLDSQTQALERRLRESEARSRKLAEENALLRQATISAAPSEEGPAGTDSGGLRGDVAEGAESAQGEGGIDDSFAKALEEAW